MDEIASYIIVHLYSYIKKYASKYAVCKNTVEDYVQAPFLLIYKSTVYTTPLQLTT
jgi:hypothetical protein